MNETFEPVPGNLRGLVLDEAGLSHFSISERPDGLYELRLGEQVYVARRFEDHYVTEDHYVVAREVIREDSN